MISLACYNFIISMIDTNSMCCCVVTALFDADPDHYCHHKKPPKLWILILLIATLHPKKFICLFQYCLLFYIRSWLRTHGLYNFHSGQWRVVKWWTGMKTAAVKTKTLLKAVPVYIISRVFRFSNYIPLKFIIFGNIFSIQKLQKNLVFRMQKI